MQYGYITMFASALPIVTFFAIAEVLLQTRTDRYVGERKSSDPFSRTMPSSSWTALFGASDPWNIYRLFRWL